MPDENRDHLAVLLAVMRMFPGILLLNRMLSFGIRYTLLKSRRYLSWTSHGSCFQNPKQNLGNLMEENIGCLFDNPWNLWGT